MKNQLKIFNTAFFANKFLLKNSALFIKLISPILLLIILLNLITEFISPDFFKISYFLAIPSYSFMYAMVMMQWHKYNLSLNEEEIKINPFRFEKENIEFWGKGLLYTIILYLLFLAGTLLSGILFTAALMIGISSGFVLFTVVFGLLSLCGILVFAFVSRYMFYFPAKAEGKYISFSNSFQQFQGLSFKYVITCGIALIPVLLLTKLVNKIINYSNIKLPILDLILDSALYMAIPFIIVSVLCVFYNWRKENHLPVTKEEEIVDEGLYGQILKEHKEKS